MVFIALFAMLALSGLAATFLPKNARLPMQWDLRGQPTWTAPRAIALLFTPALFVLLFGVTFFLSKDNAPLAGAAIIGLQAVIFTIVHATHLMFAVRHVAREK